MATLALVRALSSEQSSPRFRRINSSNMIDRMRTIPEDQLLVPSPSPKRKNAPHGLYGSLGPPRFPAGDPKAPLETSEERVRLLPVEEGKYQDEDCCDEVTCYHILTILLALMTVMSMVTQVISIPLYYDAMSDVMTSDAFIASFIVVLWQPVIFFSVLFFFVYIQNPMQCSVFMPKAPWWNVALAGVLGGLSTILVAFTSLPNRTNPGLQAILQQCSIPFAVLTRFIVLKKGINRRQFVCIFTLFIGIFITLEPTIFGLRQMGPWYWFSHEREEPNPQAWYYLVIYGLSQFPLALAYTFMEQGQKSSQVETLAYTAWYQVFQLLAYFLFVWIDFIPNFGMAQTPSSNFIQKVSNGFQCFFATSTECKNVPLLAAINTLSTAGSTLFSILLIRYAEGALFTVIVLAFVTPLGALFWTLFSATNNLHWEPIFDLSTVFLLVGVTIMMPSVVMYAYFRDDPILPEVKPDIEQLEAARNLARERAIQRRRRKRRSRHYTITYDNRRPVASWGIAVPMAAGARKLNTSKSLPNLHRLRTPPVVIGGF